MSDTPTRDALTEFSEQLERIVPPRASSDGIRVAALVSEVRPHFEALLRDRDWLEAHYQQPRYQGPNKKLANHLIAQSPYRSWTLTSVVFPGGYSTPVHDHLKWGLIGTTRGVERETKYRRTDDFSRPGFAELEFVETSDHYPIEISELLPPADDIHLMHNPGEEPSYSIHLYGGHLDESVRHTYDVETSRVKDWRPRYQITC